MKIPLPTPLINPSLLVSIAEEVTEFEKPVTGKRVPAPAILAILSKKPSEVASEAKIIKVTVTNIYEFSLLMPRYL